MSSINPRLTDDLFALVFPSGLQTFFLNCIIVLILFIEYWILMRFARSQQQNLFNSLQKTVILFGISFGLFYDVWVVFLYIYAQYWFLQKYFSIYSKCSLKIQAQLSKKLLYYRIFVLVNFVLILSVPFIFLYFNLYSITIELLITLGICVLGIFIPFFPAIISRFHSLINRRRVQQTLVTFFLIGIIGSSIAVLFSGLKHHSKLESMTQPTGITDLTIMTYNIRYGSAQEKNPLNNWDNRKGNLSAYIDTFNPDVFGVQEALLFQLDYLQTHVTNRTYAFTGFGRDNGYHQGEHTAIFFDSEKFSFIDGDTFWLSDTPRLPSNTWGNAYFRICTWARFEVKATGVQFCVFNTHYDFSDTFCELASKLIHSKISDYTANLPVFFMGDFNTHDTDNGFVYLENFGNKPLLDSFRIAHGGTAPRWASSNNWTPNDAQDRIDFIFISPNVSVNECRIPHDSYGQNQTYSDHYPVILTCRF